MVIWSARTFSAMRRRRGPAVPVALAVLAGILVSTPASAAPPDWVAPTPHWEKSVPGTGVPVRERQPDPARQRAWTAPPPVSWPRAGTAELAVPAGRGKLAAAVGLPVSVGAPASGRAAGQVRVEVFDRATTAAAGVDGILLSAATATAGGRASLAVDYAGFRYAFGGDWAARLRLVRLPACALATPTLPACRVQTPVGGRNDVTRGVVTADVAPATPDPGRHDATAGGTLFALAAADSGGSGDYKATSLSPSASWQVSTQSGDFSWSYPIRTPPALDGPAPNLALSYSAGGIDGRIATTNNQTSVIGEGFDLATGFIERRYKSCIDDGVSTKPGDQCWDGDHLSMVLGGHSGQLLHDGATGAWRPRNDDGTRVEHLTGAANGDNDGEYWRVTTTDGTQYYFGRNRLPGWATGKPETKSAWTVPVFGDDADEPCHGATFAASWCQQAYRWNLDHVVDPHGNALAHFYATEINYYGRNLSAASGTPYVRGGYPVRTDYGLRTGAEYGTAPARVVYGVTERCLPTETFDCAPARLTASTASRWPDVPFDRNCEAGAACTNKFSPTFWTRKRLTTITTQVWGGAAYRNVDAWTLTHTYPATGDGLGPAMWLDKITHAGLVGGSTALPAVDLDGIELENRVDALEGLAPMKKWRLAAVRSETGGTLTVNYSDRECSRGALPEPASNTLRCFPLYWTPEGALKPMQDWFHKYVAKQVVSIDNTGGAPFDVTTYDYVGGTAWHYDEDPMTPASRRTWNQWRGYARVKVIHGEAPEQRSETEHLYFRGMDGDPLPENGRRDVKVTDSDGGVVEDHWRLQGFERESIVHNGPGGPVVSAEITDPWLHGPTATQDGRQAFRVADAGVRTKVALAAGGWRRTETRTSFDDYGSPTQVDDRGDTATEADDRCTRYTYARNTDAWLIGPVSREEVVAVRCGATPSRPDDLVSDERTYFDGATTFGKPAVRGDVTRTEEVASWSGGPVYATTGRSTYDEHGRVVESFDAAGNLSTTEYTPRIGGPVTKTVATNPLGHTATTFYEPAWGLPIATVDANDKRTDLAYDPIGRLAKVWLPGRSKAAGQSPSNEFTYQVRTDAPVAVTSKTLRNDGSYTASYELFDSLLRPRQTQEPAPGGGRVVTDTYYNSRGLAFKRNNEYFNSAAPGTTLLAVADNEVPGQTLSLYDGAGRETVEITRVLGVEKWRTTTTYGGDRVSLDPPEGGTATTTITDAKERTIELRQYHGGAATGPYDATTYTYAKDGQLATVTDAEGNTWRSAYDLRGRRVQLDHPDAGTRTMTYDVLGQLATATDARGKKLAYAYDDLGRRIAVHENSLTGPKLAFWTYDTLAKGQPTSAARVVGGQAYVTAITGYDDDYHPTGSSMTIPAVEGALAGTYTMSTTYRLDGGVATVSLPAAGGLAAETLTFGYNELGSLSTLTSPLATYIGQTTYGKLGLPLQTRYGAVGKRVVRDYTYEEGTNRLIRALTDLELPTGSRQSDVSYTYDAAGNVTGVADTPPAGNAPSDIQCFRYDHLRRLTQAWTVDGTCDGGPSLAVLGGPAPYWHSYTYDTTGSRRTEVHHAATGDVTRTYAYPAAKQRQPHTLTSVTQQGPAGTRVDEFGYDAAGNTTTRKIDGVTQTLAWDVEGRLASVTEGSKETSYLYDADGNRLIRRDPNAVTLYLGATELKLDRATGIVRGTRYYSDGDDTIAVRTYDNKLTWQIGDQHGTAQLGVDASTLAVTRRRYAPFGTLRGTAPGWKGERGFVDGSIDPSTGLTHLGAREYDPALGRFISVDPVTEPENPQQLHGYLYANNSPPTLSDPDGLCWPSWLCDKARQAREWAERKAREAREWAERKAAEAREWARRKAEEARRWAQRKAEEARRWAARKAAEARRWAQRKAEQARRWAQRKAEQARNWVRQKARDARDWVRRKAQQAKDWVRKTVPNVVRRAWHVTRFAINLRSTAIGLAYAGANGASCGMETGLMVVCTDASFAPKGGQTIGNVFTTRSPTVGADELAHETRHTTQYAWHSGNPLSFGQNYLAATGGSVVAYWLLGPRRDSSGNVCDDPFACYNVFEMDADLHKGNYYHSP